MAGLGAARAGAEVRSAKDPVCGMDLKPAEAKFSSASEGQTWFFCSAQCKEQFERRRSAGADRPRRPRS